MTDLYSLEEEKLKNELIEKIDIEKLIRLIEDISIEDMSKDIPEKVSKSNPKKIRTQLKKKFLDEPSSKELYVLLKKNIQWENSIYSNRQSRITRKGYSVDMTSSNYVDEIIISIVSSAMGSFNISNIRIYGIYVNYYRDGKDWAPSHKHEDSNQLVISLGVTRQLKVGDKTFSLDSGDIILFGKSNHSLLMDESINRGRISIAVFLESW